MVDIYSVMCIKSAAPTHLDCRLLEFAPSYFDLSTFQEGETKRTLQRVINKKAGKYAQRPDGNGADTRDKKKRRKE